eukprot:9765258-Prorocentrum_lima.AAC.1
MCAAFEHHDDPSSLTGRLQPYVCDYDGSNERPMRRRNHLEYPTVVKYYAPGMEDVNPIQEMAIDNYE